MLVQLRTEQEARAREFVDLEAKARETQSTLAALDAQVKDLRGRVGKEPLEYAQKNSRENTLLPKLQDQLAELQMKRQDLSKQYKPASGVMKSLDDQIAGL